MLEDTKTSGKIKATYKLEEISEVEESIINALEVEDAHNNRLKFEGGWGIQLISYLTLIIHWLYEGFGSFL